MSCLRSIVVAVAVVFTFFVGHAAVAQSVPFKASGMDAEYSPVSGDYKGVGNGTHLGKHRIEGNVRLVSVYPPKEGVYIAGKFEGTQVAIAANGDRLEAKLSGEVVLVYVGKDTVEGKWYPAFEITGGTGRFANASGKFEGVAINPPFNPASATWGFNWSMLGKIHLGKKNDK